MSNNTQKIKIDNLLKYTTELIHGTASKKSALNLGILNTDYSPEDILETLDAVIDNNYSLSQLKPASARLFHILFNTLKKQHTKQYQHDVLTILQKDNNGVISELANGKQYIKQINKIQNRETINFLLILFNNLQQFLNHYTVMQNSIFPEIEKSMKHHQCLKIMWSYHDDIKKNIKSAKDILNSSPFDLHKFNKISSRIYFDINTTVFREEYILFELLNKQLHNEDSSRLPAQFSDFKLKYADTYSIDQLTQKNQPDYGLSDDSTITLPTGKITAKQIELIFNHLPVDITFVDEHNRVKYFSNPKNRLFPRTTGIIDRLVQNCHPAQSVDTVNKIIESFKNGSKDSASFWIHLEEQFVLIQYFAVRDKNKIYKGIVEVSQEISDIQKLSGDHRLLDW